MRIPKLVVYLALGSLLSGCFLEQHEPKTNSGSLTQWIGVVSVEDVEAGERKGASASAFFVEANEAQQQPLSRAAAMASRAEDADTTMKCERTIGPPVEKSSSLATRKRVSVGRLFFGPALQTTLQVFFQDAGSSYRLPLESGLAPGAYQLAAEGGRTTEPFSEVLTLPEALSDVRVNRVDIREPGVTLHRDRDIEIAWKTPTVLNDQNILLIDFDVQNEETKAGVHCVGREANLNRRAGDIEWTIDRSMLADFPTDVTAQLHIVRAHLRKAPVRNSAIQFQGLRTSLAMFDFAM